MPMEICPSCQQPILRTTTVCPHCSQPIPRDSQPPGHLEQDEVTATERSVAAGGDIHGNVITGDIGGDVIIQQTVQVEIPPPPPPERPPQIPTFVGREAELKYYSEKLETHRLVMITGMPGVGKTALAVRLAQRFADPYRLFWYSFHPHEGVEDVVWKLAAFLAWGGQDDLWRMLNRASQTGGQKLSWGVIFDYLLTMIRGRDYLLCLDDFHLVDDQSLALLGGFLQKLAGSLQSGEITIILTSRSRPDFARNLDFEPLGGMSPQDAERLVRANNLDLPGDSIARLHTVTAGNAQFMTLAIQALQKAGDPVQLIDRLAETENVEDYLLQKVDESLDEDERAVMSAAAVLLGYGGTRDALEAVLDTGGIRRVLHRLTDQHLLTSAEGKSGREYSQHAILRAFYYDLLGQRERREKHLRAGRYYSSYEKDLLKAGLHFDRAGEKAQAAQLVTGDVRGLINQGHARVLQRLLERLSPEETGPELGLRVAFALGRVNALLGERQLARQKYEETLAALAASPASDESREIETNVYNSMGELLELENPQEALGWLERGIAKLEQYNLQGSRPLEASLYVRLGFVYTHLGQYAQALEALTHGLDCLPQEPLALRSTALSNLSAVYYLMGEVDESQKFVEQALEISQQLDDDFETAGNRINLGILKYAKGDWLGAIADFQAALSIAEGLGSLNLRVSPAVNLGAAYSNLGEDELAFLHLNRALELARGGKLRLMEALALFRLGELHCRRGDTAEAGKALRSAEKLALENEDKSQLAAVYSLWAEADLAAGDLDAAGEHVQQSLALAEELGEDVELGISLRVQGQVLLARQDCRASLDTLARSAEMLQEIEVYEAARARLYQALALEACGQAAEAEPIFLETGAIFRRLGARRELALVDGRIRKAEQAPAKTPEARRPAGEVAAES